MPILGSLFRSTEYRKGQTELVIVVTPYLVSPVSDNEIALPTDGFRAPDAGSQFFLNQESDGVTGGSRPMPRAAEDAPPPEIGLNSQNAAEQVADNRRQPGEGAETAEAAAPGFSIQ